jgi:hypothetical protein
MLADLIVSAAAIAAAALTLIPVTIILRSIAKGMQR